MSFRPLSTSPARSRISPSASQARSLTSARRRRPQSSFTLTFEIPKALSDVRLGEINPRIGSSIGACFAQRIQRRKRLGSSPR